MLRTESSFPSFFPQEFKHLTDQALCYSLRLLCGTKTMEFIISWGNRHQSAIILMDVQLQTNLNSVMASAWF